MDYKKYNDYELIYMVSENDESSKEILFEKYKPIIISLTNRYFQLNTNLGYDFDDYYQEAIVSFYEAIENFDSNKGTLFYTFVIVCVERNLLSFLRKISSKSRNIYTHYVSLDELVDIVEDKEKSIENITRFREIEDIYKKVIYSAPIESGSILELRYNGFSYKEISILLEIPISSIEFKIRKYKKILRLKLSKYNCK